MSSLTIKKNIISLLSGLLFGIGMIISGMTDPDKVIGFLDITGQWDPTLIFVLGGALFVFSLFYHLIIKHREKSINDEAIPDVVRSGVDFNLIVGAIIFGIGWGLVGFCPGPIVSSLSSGNVTVYVFFISMLVGMFGANKLFSKK
jgi:uncharacterized membrane protein YedE/YeeE